MGLFSGLFNKKEKKVTEVVVNNDEVISDGEVGEAVAPVVVDPSNVLEQMQNNFAEEVAKEEANASLEEEPMAIFNQNIALDSSNPMSIFGSESEEKKDE